MATSHSPPQPPDARAIFPRPTMGSFTPEVFNNMTMAGLYAGAEFITHLAATALLAQAGVVDNADKLKGIRLLDIGTGMGQLTEMLYARKDDWEGKVTLGDIDQSMLEACVGKVQANGWEESAVKTMDVMAMDEPDEAFSHVFANFVYMLLPKPLDALKESIRVLERGGTLGFTTWSHSGMMFLLQHAQTLIPNAPSTPRIIDSLIQSNANGLWYDPGYIRTELEALGLDEIKIEAYDHRQQAESAKALSYAMRVLIKLTTAMWPDKDAAWAMFDKMEQILRNDFGEGPAHVTSVALVITAKKPE